MSRLIAGKITADFAKDIIDILISAIIPDGLNSTCSNRSIVGITTPVTDDIFSK
jgi:hypothetical protein